MPAAHIDPADKPLLRGVSHQLAFFAFLLATGVLTFLVRGVAAHLAVVVYGASICGLLGISALYHRGRWSEAASRWIQRMDHSAIFVLIAGSYSPLFILLAPPGERTQALVTVWAFAALGVLKALLWAEAPSWVNAALAVAVGWCGVTHVVSLAPTMGAAALALIVAAGITYTVGALVYAVRHPDPAPKVFGYHEVFHALVVLGGAVHFAHVVLVLHTAGALGPLS